MKRLAIALALTTATLLSGCYDIGDGSKNGTITKFAKTGVVCKTWEAEIMRGGRNGGSGVMGAPFDFTIEDPVLVTKVQDAFESQREVRIHYSSEAISFCRSDSDSHFLTSIEFVAPGQGGTVRDSNTPAGTIAAPSGAAITNADVKALIENQTRELDQNNRTLDLLTKGK